MTPLKKSIDGLNKTAQQLPDQVSLSVEKAMKEAFAEKLAKMFNLSTTIAIEAQQATRQLSAVTSTLNESGQDFVMAARAFQQSKFPEALRESVSGLLETKERMTASSESLSARMQEVRESLLVMQTQWQLLAKSAETELETCRTATQQMNAGLAQLQTSSQVLGEGVEVTAVAAKQLKETRLEVMRDRKLSIDIAETVRERLAVDASSIEICQSFAAALEKILIRWSDKHDKLEELRDQFNDIALRGRSEDNSELEKLSSTIKSITDSLGDSLADEMTSTIVSQKEAISQFGIPLWEMKDSELSRAKELASKVLDDLVRIQTRLSKGQTRPSDSKSSI